MVTAIWRDKRELHTAIHPHDAQAQQKAQNIAARLDTTYRQLRVCRAKELAQTQHDYFQNAKDYKSVKHLNKVLGKTGHRGSRRCACKTAQ